MARRLGNRVINVSLYNELKESRDVYPQEVDIILGSSINDIKINQDLDRPIVRLQNLNLSAGGTLWHKSNSPRQILRQAPLFFPVLLQSVKARLQPDRRT